MLPSPIHHGLHSDPLGTWTELVISKSVAIPYSSRVAFGLLEAPLHCMLIVGCHPLFITGCIRTIGWKPSIICNLALPSPIHHGLHSDCEYISYDLKYEGCCHPLFITGCIRTPQNLSNAYCIYRCHPLFITGCIRTILIEYRLVYGFRLPSPIHHGLHSDSTGLYSSYLPKRVAIPYSSRVAFGQYRDIIAVLEMKSCHPLFITGCIRTIFLLILLSVTIGCHPLFITGCIRTTHVRIREL